MKFNTFKFIDTLERNRATRKRKREEEKQMKKSNKAIDILAHKSGIHKESLKALVESQACKQETTLVKKPSKVNLNIESIDNDADLSEDERNYQKALVQYLVGCNAKKRDYEMSKIEKYRLNNMQYPIPWTNYGKPKEDDLNLFTIEAGADVDAELEERIKMRRYEVVQKILKG